MTNLRSILQHGLDQDVNVIFANLVVDNKIVIK